MDTFDLIYGNIVELLIKVSESSLYKEYNKDFIIPSVDEFIEDLKRFNRLHFSIACFNKFGTPKSCSNVTLNSRSENMSLEEVKGLLKVPFNINNNYYFRLYTYWATYDSEKYPIRDINIQIPTQDFFNFKEALVQNSVDITSSYYS